jgi:D-specific alpha-keto acid dehydrogenase
VSHSEPAPAAIRPARPLAATSSSSAPAAPEALTTGIAVYGCDQDEAALFQALAARFGVLLTVTESPISETNVELALGKRCVSVGHKTRVTNPTLLALRRVGVEYLSTRSIGYNHIDVEYAERIGLAVGNVAYSPDSVADYTLMLTLMAVRNAKSVIRRADSRDYRLGDVRGKELRDLAVGVVGTGRIGTAVVERLRGFGCRVVACDEYRNFAVEYLSIDELLQVSDVVTLHTPLNAQTHHLLNRQRIALMKSGAYVINTGRGSLIDTAALISALEDGRLGGAALDVLEGEEGVFYADRGGLPVSESLARLQRLPNVLISPHIAYYTDHALSDMVENTIINCLTFEKGIATWPWTD